MTPLLACFPVCLTFVAIGIVGAIVVTFGMYNHVAPEEEAPGTETPSTDTANGPPPLWVFPLMLLGLTLLMLALNWYWPE